MRGLPAEQLSSQRICLKNCHFSSKLERIGPRPKSYFLIYLLFIAEVDLWTYFLHQLLQSKPETIPLFPLEKETFNFF